MGFSHNPLHRKYFGYLPANDIKSFPLAIIMNYIKNNLRTTKGTIKGNAGEAIFVSTFGHIHATRFDTYAYLDKLPLNIPNHISEFLKKNWNTIDAFELKTNTEKTIVEGLILYEVKTMNYYTKNGINFGKKPIITQNALNLYTVAHTEGIEVKSAWIVFHNDWNYEIIIKPFFPNEYIIWNGNSQYAKSNTINIESPLKKGISPFRKRFSNTIVSQNP